MTSQRQRIQDISPQSWVKVAVNLAGNALKPGTNDPVEVVAQELNVSRQTVYNWIKRGSMERVAHRDVRRLSDLSRVPVEWLTPEDTLS